MDQMMSQNIFEEKKKKRTSFINPITKMIPRGKKPQQSPQKLLNSPAPIPQEISVFFPDNYNYQIRIRGNFTITVEELVNRLRVRPDFPVRNDVVEAYGLYASDSRASNSFLVREKVPLHSYYINLETDLEYKLRPKELFEPTNADGTIFVKILLPTLKIPSIVIRISPSSSVEDLKKRLLQLLPETDQNWIGYGLYFGSWASELSLDFPIEEYGIKQLAEITFKQRGTFVFELSDPEMMEANAWVEFDKEGTIGDLRAVVWKKWPGSLSTYDANAATTRKTFGIRSVNWIDAPIIERIDPSVKLLNSALLPDDEIAFEVSENAEVQAVVRVRQTPSDDAMLAASTNRGSSYNFIQTLENEFPVCSFDQICFLHPASLSNQDINCSSSEEDEIKSIGKLHITSYRVFLSSFSITSDTTNRLAASVDVPLSTISRIEKSSKLKVILTCKDFRTVRFQVSSEKVQQEIYDVLLIKCFPGVKHLNKVFAFTYTEPFPRELDGWKVYSPRREFNRMRVLANPNWRVTPTNENYAKSPTYPRILCVPSAFSDSELEAVYSFRSKGRIPALTYMHKNRASICRSSQPKVGLSSKSQADKQMVDLIRCANFVPPQQVPAGHNLYLIDARPRANAIANRAKDGGYEMNYPNCKIKFMDIDNIHVVRGSLNTMVQLCNGYTAGSQSGSWLTAVANSKWLEHTRRILKAAVDVSYLVSRGSSVLVHCSDGWDRTPQITSLAQILLSAYYRTIEGFEVLIEKDWCSFGHKFSQRLGHGDANYNDSERSPVFVQFIDCVWQILQQFPDQFEYNANFLQCIVHHSTSCRFGTFLYNSECQRRVHKVRNATVSLWSYINNNVTYFRNPDYMTLSDDMNEELVPLVAEHTIQIWYDLYCVHSDSIERSKSAKVSHHMSHIQLQRENDLLREQVLALSAQMSMIVSNLAVEDVHLIEAPAPSQRPPSVPINPPTAPYHPPPAHPPIPMLRSTSFSHIESQTSSPTQSPRINQTVPIPPALIQSPPTPPAAAPKAPVKPPVPPPSFQPRNPGSFTSPKPQPVPPQPTSPSNNLPPSPAVQWAQTVPQTQAPTWAATQPQAQSYKSSMPPPALPHRPPERPGTSKVPRPIRPEDAPTLRMVSQPTLPFPAQNPAPVQPVTWLSQEEEEFQAALGSQVRFVRTSRPASPSGSVVMEIQPRIPPVPPPRNRVSNRISNGLRGGSWFVRTSVYCNPSSTLPFADLFAEEEESESMEDQYLQELQQTEDGEFYEEEESDDNDEGEEGYGSGYYDDSSSSAYSSFSS